MTDREDCARVVLDSSITSLLAEAAGAYVSHVDIEGQINAILASGTGHEQQGTAAADSQG